jgi:hypothetical protein
MTSVWFRTIIFKSKARLQSECVVLAAHWSSFLEPPKNLNFRASKNLKKLLDVVDYIHYDRANL